MEESHLLGLGGRVWTKPLSPPCTRKTPSLSVVDVRLSIPAARRMRRIPRAAAAPIDRSFRIRSSFPLRFLFSFSWGTFRGMLVLRVKQSRPFHRLAGLIGEGSRHFQSAVGLCAFGFIRKSGDGLIGIAVPERFRVVDVLLSHLFKCFVRFSSQNTEIVVKVCNLLHV